MSSPLASPVPSQRCNRRLRRLGSRRTDERSTRESAALPPAVSCNAPPASSLSAIVPAPRVLLHARFGNLPRDDDDVFKSHYIPSGARPMLRLAPSRLSLISRPPLCHSSASLPSTFPFTCLHHSDAVSLLRCFLLIVGSLN